MREKTNNDRSRMALWGLVVLVVATGTAVLAEEPATSQEPEATAITSAEKRTETRVEQKVLQSPRLAGGLRAHIDPETGALVVPALKARGELQLSPELEDALSTSHQGLRAVTLPNGFTYVDLQGRFRSATMATVGEDGTIEVHHAVPAVPEMAEAADAESAAASREQQP